MPYVRRRGSHLAIVHGARDPETKQVRQEVLLTIHSKAEALAALGKAGQAREREMFRHWMERRYPDVRFSWREIDARLEEMKDELPDLAPSRRERMLGGGFREALIAFMRHLMAADPQSLDSARDLVEEHRVELEFLAELIGWRLEVAARSEPSEWSRDPFGWRLALGKPDVDSGMEENAAGWYERGEYDRAEHLFRLFVDAYPNYAEGWNYLGLIAMRRGELEDALAHFEMTEKVGRTLFRKRIPKADYWLCLETRPYMRGLRNQWSVLNRLGRYAKALKIAERLDRECGDEVVATAYRANTYLNTGEWQLAHDAAISVAGFWPTESLIAAFAAFELRQRDIARTRFVHAMLNGPRTVGIPLGKRLSKPRYWREAEDHNGGIVALENLAGYLAKRSRASKTFFDGLWKDAELAKLREEVISSEYRKDRLDREDEELRRKLFDRLHELHSWEFAQKVAAQEASR